MTTRLITRRFRNDPEMGVQMLINGEWYKMPMVPPCPSDPDGELAHAAVDKWVPGGYFIVSVKVSVHPTHIDGLQWFAVEVDYPPQMLEIVTELDDGQIVDGWVSGGDKSTLKLRLDDGLFWRRMWGPCPVRWRHKNPNEPEFRMQREPT